MRPIARPGKIARGEPTIYFLADHTAQAIKIGYSTNVPDRVSTLQTASATPLALLATMPGTINQERMLHQRFECMHGEWFKPTPELLAFIRDHADLTEAFYQCVREKPRDEVSEPTPQPIIVAPEPRRQRRQLISRKPLSAQLTPRVVQGETWVERLHKLAVVEITMMLIVAAASTIHIVFLPRIKQVIPFSWTFDLFVMFFFAMVCLYGLTYTKAREDRRRRTA